MSKPFGQPAGPADRGALLALALVVAVGGRLRFRNLGAESLWLDEAATWLQSRGDLVHLLTSTANENYPPLHNLLVLISIRLFGEAEWALRLPSALAGTLNIIAIYGLGTLLGGRVAGLFAALFLALSGFHIWYSQEARMYAVLALAATLFAAMAIRFMTAGGRPAPGWMQAAGIALLYTHPYGALTWLSIIAGIAVAGRMQPRPWRQGLGTLLRKQILVGLAFLPWALNLARRAIVVEQNGFWIQYPTPGYVLNQVLAVASGPFGLALIVAGTAAALFAAGRAGEEPGPRQRSLAIRPAVAALGLWAFGPAALGLLASLTVEPVFLARYLIASLPPLLLLAAMGWGRAAGNPVRLVLAGAAATAMAVVALLTGSPGQREQWRDVGSYLAENVQPSDCLIVARPYVYNVLRYYYPTQPECFVRADKGADLASLDLEGARVFVVMSHADRDRQAGILAAFAAPEWQEQVRRYRGITLFEYSRPAPR